MVQMDSISSAGFDPGPNDGRISIKTSLHVELEVIRSGFYMAPHFLEWVELATSMIRGYIFNNKLSC